MGDACGGADVNETMQQLPSLSAKAYDPLSRGCDCKRNEQNKARVSRHDERPLRKIIDHRVQDEELIQPDIAHKMQCGVEECEQSRHAAGFDDAVPSRDSPKR